MTIERNAPHEKNAPPEIEAPIIIIGGGLAGMMTALMLARSGHEVMLLAEGRLPADTDTPATADTDTPATADTATAPADTATMTASMIRTTTLNPFAFGLLDDLGIAAAVTATPIHHIEVSDGRPHPRSRPRPPFNPGFAARQGLAADDRLLGWDSADDAPLAYTAYNHELIAAAARCIAASPRITYRGGIRITGWQPPQAHAMTGCLHDAAGQAYRCGLAVACDGAASPLRGLAGIKTISRNPHQTAIVALIRLAQPHQHRAWQRFLEGGPLALMPLDAPLDAPGLASLVWTLDEGEAERLMDMDEAAFNAALNEAAQSTDGGLALASPRHGWPLRLHYVPKPYSERLVLVGDAAHAIHPLAGQGFNLAMGDAAGLAAALGWGRAHGLDMGDAQILEHYARGRLAETAAMTMATHGLHLLFSTAPAPLRATAAMAMALLDRSPLKGLARGFAAGGLNRGLNRRLHHLD